VYVDRENPESSSKKPSLTQKNRFRLASPVCRRVVRSECILLMATYRVRRKNSDFSEKSFFYLFREIG
jgi:hypothetical protein